MKVFLNTYLINHQSTTSQMLHCGKSVTSLFYYISFNHQRERKSGVNRKHNKICLWWIAVCFSFLNYFQFFIFFSLAKAKTFRMYYVWFNYKITNHFILFCKDYLHVSHQNLIIKNVTFLVKDKSFYLPLHFIWNWLSLLVKSKTFVFRIYSYSFTRIS